jgi:hypothetical protein
MNVFVRGCWTAAVAGVLLSMAQTAVAGEGKTEAQMPWENSAPAPVCFWQTWTAISASEAASA